MAQATPTTQRSEGPGLALAVFAAGAATAVLLGVYGRVHDPTGETALTAFFSGQLQFKVWAATLAALLAVAQVISALRLYGRFRTPAPPWLGDVHRLTGTLAFVCTLPVAYHCLWAIGFDLEPGLDRVFVHSVAGCLFYGVIVVKVAAVRAHRLGWVLPFAGGTAFALLVLLWFTSSFWFFTTFDGSLL